MAGPHSSQDVSGRKRSSGGTAEPHDDLTTSGTSSPYFASPRTANTPTSTSKSRHFASSLSPAAQSVSSVGIACLEVDQFMNCPVFAKHYRTGTGGNASSGVHRKTRRCHQRRIERSARHLCHYGCFYWAFAPTREWHGLREAARALGGCPPDRILSGWRCVLLRPKRDESKADFMRQFLSPDGERFGNAADVLRRLNLTGASSLRRVKKSRISATTRSVSVLPSSASAPAPRKKRTACQEAECSSLRGIPRRLSVTSALGNAPCDADQHEAWSPFGLLEELFADDPWKLLLSTILLNRTTRRQVDPVFHDFIARFPSPEQTAAADVSDILNIVTPLGIKHRRSNGIIRFSREYILLIKSKRSRHFTDNESKTDNESEESEAVDTELEDDEILSLFGCGKYALCAYKIFIRGDLDCAVHDHALHYYVDYKRAMSN